MWLLTVPLGTLRARSSCVVCGAPAATAVEPVVSDDASLGELDGLVPELPMCAACAAEQRLALRRPLYARRWFVLVPGILTGVTSALVPLTEPLFAAGLFAVLVGAWVVALRAHRASRNEALPAIVCGGRQGVVEVRVNRDAGGARAQVEPRTVYRSLEGAEVRPSVEPVRARDELSTAFVVGGTIAGAVLAGVAYNGLFVDVHCTNRDAEAARLVLDDDVIAVGKGTSVRYVRTGSHVFGVECPSGKRRLFRASLTADDRVYVDAQTLCEGGEPKIERAYGGGGMGSPFRGI